MNLEKTLDTLSQMLQSVSTNIYSICVQEIVGFGKFKIVLEGKYIRDIKESKDFSKFKSYHTKEVQFLSGKCCIYITDIELLY